jgi:hypothetical protein
MKDTLFILAAIALMIGCRMSDGMTPVPSHSNSGVVVYSYKDMEDSHPTRFYLKGAYGIVLRYYRDGASPSKVTYELFSESDGRVLVTQDQSEFRQALQRLPRSATVDFYDTCTVSLSSKSDKGVLSYCDELGLAGAYYVMCTDFGSVSEPQPWRWGRESE